MEKFHFDSIFCAPNLVWHSDKHRVMYLRRMHIWQETTTLFTYSNFVTLGYKGYKGYLFQNSIALIEILIFCIYFYTTLVLLYENYFKLLLCWEKIVAMSRENKHFAYVKTQAQISSVTAKLIISFVFATRIEQFFTF